MMTQVLCATLKPASGGFGQWDWTEPVLIEGAETIEDYEDMLADLQVDWERTEELSGRIQVENGPVYKFNHRPNADDSECISYEMVWVQND